MNLIFCEESYIVKRLITPEEIDAAYRLRHEVFVDELRWVPPLLDGREIDQFDAFAMPFGIISPDGKVVGHVRLITSPDPFMIESVFSCLLPKDKPFIKPPNMVESTRICIKKEYRNSTIQSMPLAHVLYKAIYNWSLINAITHMVTIIEKRYYLLLKRSKFPFESVGEFLPLGDGVLAGIAVIDWSRVEKDVQAARPDFYRWLINLQVPAHTL